jgi:hypothetical protein
MSPPYINLEIYTGMTQFETENQYYLEFLKSLILNCRNNIQEVGSVCINISDKIYDKYTANLEIQKQMGWKKQRKDMFWRC